MQLISRADAIARGLKSYFTGAPCSRGHVAKRTTDSCVCHECRLAMLAKKRLEIGCVPRSKTLEEKKQARKESLRKYAANNPEKIKQAQAKYKAQHPERRKASVKKWDTNNTEARRIHRHTRRARKMESGGVLSVGLAKKLFQLQKGKCACCKKPLGVGYQLDHIIPIALGGPNTDTNIQLLRALCNRQKGAKHPIDFMQGRGLLL